MEITAEAHRTAKLYLNLLKNCLTRVLFPDRSFQHDLASSTDQSFADRFEGRDWPTEAETMVGIRRLDNIVACVFKVIENDIPGDLVDTGAWRGGTSILMRAVLKAYGDCDRRVIVAGSLEGSPRSDGVPSAQDADLFPAASYRAVSLEQVKSNFARYGLLDEQVRFLPGRFNDTPPSAPVEKVAVLRVDGNQYESTMDSLVSLYDKVSSRGFVIIDGYGAFPQSRAAVSEFRQARAITEPVNRIDWTGVFWQKGNSDPVSLAHSVKVPVNCSDFDEEAYLRANPDVADAVENGRLRSGLEHFLVYGQHENRPRR